MKIKNYLVVLAGIGALFATIQSGFAQGALTPPGAPAPTMKSLDQIYAQLEARTAITNTSSLVTISQPGSYYLTGNLTVSSGDGIDINTNGVTLDLNGFTISSSAPFLDNASGSGILIASGLRDITIYNGHIVGHVISFSGGIYIGGGGFSSGINCADVLQNVLVSRLSVSGFSYYGINLSVTNSTVVEDCTVTTVGHSGITASIVKNCSAWGCAENAIFCDHASDCRGQSSDSAVAGYGIYASATVQNCYGYSAGSSSGIAATTAQNCYGQSSTGDGIDASTAQNCYGQSSTGTGLDVTYTAENCYGSSASGDGIDAYTALNCYGYATDSNGNGIGATTAENCFGQGVGGDGIFAFMVQNSFGYSSANGEGIAGGEVLNSTGRSYHGDGILGTTVQNSYGEADASGTGIIDPAGTVSGSYGNSYSGTGLNADIADFCRGYASYGIPMNVTHNVNTY
jgi:hypothetical protein